MQEQDSSFGSIIRELREQARFTQGELGERVNLRQYEISLLEMDKHPPDMRVLFDLADVFKKEWHELVPKKFYILVDPIDMEIAQNLENLSIEAKKHLLKIIKSIVEIFKRPWPSD